MQKHILTWVMVLVLYFTTTAGLAACASVNPIVTTEVPVVSYTLTAEDYRQIRCLADNVYHEARGEPEAGQEAVAHVVRNRVASGAFAPDICGVVWQHISRHRCQFSWTCDGISDRVRGSRNHALYDVIFENMTAFYRNNPVDNSDGATYYHAYNVRPAWSRDFIRTAQIGAHIFYRG